MTSNKKKNKNISKRLNKKFVIPLAVCLTALIIILFIVVVLPSFNKTKGSVPIYKTYKPGDRFCLGEECFYAMSDDGTTVKALAEWNLNVGSNKNPSVPEGIQDESVRGENPSGTKYGNVAFSTSTYWSGKVGENLDYKGSYSSPNFPFVFDDNSNIHPYIEYYEDYLQGIGYPSVNVTLPQYKDLMPLGCTNTTGSCYNSDPWVYQTTYWTGSAGDDYYLWYVYISGSYNHYYYSNDSSCGVRPMITIQKSEFAEIIGYEGTPESDSNSGDDSNSNQTNNTAEDEFCLDTECFYIIENNEKNNTVTALAKYNLLVGNEVILNEEAETFEEYFKSTPIDPNSEGYGLQSIDAVGYKENSTSWKGTVAFQNVIEGHGNMDGSDFWPYGYWVDSNGNILDKYKAFKEEDDEEDYIYYVYDDNSSINSILQDYNNELKKIGYNVDKINLLSYTQSKNLNCWHSHCDNAPEWLLSTSYWTGSAESEHLVWYIEADYGMSRYGEATNPYGVGVRPVITISKDELSKEPNTSQPSYDTPTTDNNADSNNKTNDDKTTTTNNNGSNSKTSEKPISQKIQAKYESNKPTTNSKTSIKTTKKVTTKAAAKVKNLNSNIKVAGIKKIDFWFYLFITIDAILLTVVIVELVLWAKEKKAK